MFAKFFFIKDTFQKWFHNSALEKSKRLILGEIEENHMFYHRRNNLSSVPKMVSEIRKCQLSPLDLLASKRIMNFLLEWMYVRVELCLEVERGRRKSLVSTVTYELLVGHITTRRARWLSSPFTNSNFSQDFWKQQELSKTQTR